ncbi:ribosomal protein S18-alanine N-acetyltransferase [Marinobacterium sp. LSUCC0821]|uniref:ribosomal protein S18-alanine N-acetyltransferase n=1 Tax=Marinobacterium sp. LSUCC0821 TaxID=2668067 RepID=UPI0014529FE5|nr:ribosomal protein S18-alanine N-acetyltransferase [Marinobacterium sp. LSUCC0821]QJD72214.1 ribosomal protein S18-alanine N-acetyltransferase [Marinobacterium sp. LSUCC0821]
MRVASQQDLATIVALDQDTFPDHWSESQWLTYLNQSNRYIVTLIGDEKPVGYAVFSILFDEAELLRIGVLPQFQGAGIGHRLLQSSINVLHELGTKRLLLEVRQSNIAAIRLYKSLGFSEDGVRKGYYPLLQGSGREDAILMSK